GEQLFCEQDAGLVGGGKVARAGLVGKRAVHRLAHGRVRMAEARRAPGGGKIDELAPVVGGEVRAAAADHRLREEPQMRHRRDRSAFAGVEAGHVALPGYLKKVRTSSRWTTWQ